MKNIVIVNGSPRKSGNSRMLAEAFAKGAEASGNKVEFFDVIDNKVEGCISCKTCWSKGKPCVFDDGFNTFAKLLEPADVLVFATPVYWGTYPAQLKALVDKFFAYGIKRTKVDIRGNKKVVLLASGDGKKETAFNEMITLCGFFTDYLQWEFAGCVTAPELVDLGEIVETVAGKAALEEAEELGQNI